jgi:tetratricopeptide (TPR) repeat protein
VRHAAGIFLAIFMMAAGYVAAHAEGEAGAAATLPAIDQLIGELGSPDFTTRDRASRLLQQYGSRAEAALRRAASNPDDEVKARVTALLTRIIIADTPDVPAAIRKWSVPYYSGNYYQRWKLMHSIPDDAWTLDLALRLMDIERAFPAVTHPHPASDLERKWEQDNRVELLRLTCDRIGRMAHDKVVILALEHRDRAEQLITELYARVDGGCDSLLFDYVALRAWRGPEALRDSVREWEAKAQGPNAARAHRVLCVLHRALGEDAAALKNAEDTGDVQLRFQMLRATCQWGPIAAYAKQHPTDYERGFQGYGDTRLRYLYLAGDKPALQDEIVAAIKCHREEDRGREPAEMRDLQLCAGVGTALNIWQERKELPACFDTLLEQERYAEAFEMLKRMDPQSKKAQWDPWRMDRAWAVALYELGATDQALDFIGRENPARFAETGPQFYHQLVIDALVAKQPWRGRTIAAEGRAFLGEKVPPYFEFRFGFVPIYWKQLLAEIYPEKSTEERERMLNALVSGGMAAGEAQSLCAAAAEYVQHPPPSTAPATTNKRTDPRVRFVNDGPTSAEKLYTIAETLRRYGLYDEAWKLHSVTAFEKQGEKQLEALVDMAIEKSRWSLAVELIDRQFARQPEPRRIWAKGWVLEQAGQVEEGRRLQAAARWLPLGNSQQRAFVIGEMLQHGATPVAVETNALNFRVGDFDDFILFTASHTCSIEEAEKRGDFAAAADMFAQCLDSTARWNAAYTSFVMHRLLALGALQQHHTTDAILEAERTREALPGKPDLLFDLVPRLDQAGESKAADQLFEEVWRFNAEILKAYPRSIRHHQRMAQLAQRCGRHVDEGREHAREALRLDPEDAPFRDQVAEWLRRDSR